MQNSNVVTDKEASGAAVRNLSFDQGGSSI